MHLVRAPLRQLVPGVAARWRPPAAGPRAVRLARWLAAALIGIATHLGWDSFTHRDGWVVVHVEALQTVVLGLRAADLMQLCSSVLGLVVLLWWSVQWWRHTEPVRGRPALAGNFSRTA